MSIGRPKKDKLKVPASTRLEPEVHEALTAVAEEENRTFSQVLEFAAIDFAIKRGRLSSNKPKPRHSIFPTLAATETGRHTKGK